MSKYYKPPLYNERGQQNNWINIIYQSHDQICGCNKVIEHLNDIINNQKCHHSTKENTTKEITGTTDSGETNFDEGDLEQLFAENFEDEG